MYMVIEFKVETNVALVPLYLLTNTLWGAKSITTFVVESKE